MVLLSSCCLFLLLFVNHQRSMKINEKKVVLCSLAQVYDEELTKMLDMLLQHLVKISDLSTVLE